MVSYPREKPRSQALTIIQCKLYRHCFEVGIQRYAHRIPRTVNGTRNMPYPYHNFDKRQKVCKLILEVCYHLWHVYYEWITLCKHYHMHIHCMYMFYFVGPDIPVIVGVTVGVVGIPLLIVIVTVVVLCLVWCGKQKGWDNTNSVHKIAENFMWRLARLLSNIVVCSLQMVAQGTCRWWCRNRWWCRWPAADGGRTVRCLHYIGQYM